MKHVFIIALMGVGMCVFSCSLSDAIGQNVGGLKQSKDVPGLMRLLRHHDGRIRSQAAVALSQVIRQVEESESLAPHVLPLVDVTLRDPYSTVREYAGRALQHCLQNVTDVSILRGAVPPLVDSLDATEVEEKRRRYCAVQLSRVIPQIKHEPLLVQSVPMLLSATTDDPSEEVREYGGRALKIALPRIHDSQVRHSGTVALARVLQHRDAKRRQYAAVLLSWLVPKVTDPSTLRAISDRVSEAARKDRNDNVREYAGRAARHIKQQLQTADTEAKKARTNGK